MAHYHKYIYIECYKSNLSIWKLTETISGSLHVYEESWIQADLRRLESDWTEGMFG